MQPTGVQPRHWLVIRSTGEQSMPWLADAVYCRQAETMVGWCSLLVNSWCPGWLTQPAGEQLIHWLADAVYFWTADAVYWQTIEANSVYLWTAEVMVGWCSLLANSWSRGWLMQSTGEPLMPWLADAVHWQIVDALKRTVDALAGWCSLLADSWDIGWLMQWTGEQLRHYRLMRSTCEQSMPWLADAVFCRQAETIAGWCNLLVNSWWPGWLTESTGEQLIHWLTDAVYWRTVDALVGGRSLVANWRGPGWRLSLQVNSLDWIMQPTGEQVWLVCIDIPIHQRNN